MEWGKFTKVKGQVTLKKVIVVYMSSDFSQGSCPGGMSTQHLFMASGWGYIRNVSYTDMETKMVQH